jgi:hypothetical protein
VVLEDVSVEVVEAIEVVDVKTARRLLEEKNKDFISRKLLSGMCVECVDFVFFSLLPL